jgi:transcriptional antiterminator RfaH
LEIHLQGRAAQKLLGVVRLVMNGTAPAAVPDGIIAALRARESEDGLFDLPRPPKFRPGDRVLHGPLAGHIGLFAAMRPRERVSLLLSWLGRVELAADALERLP